MFSHRSVMYVWHPDNENTIVHTYFVYKMSCYTDHLDNKENAMSAQAWAVHVNKRCTSYK